MRHFIILFLLKLPFIPLTVVSGDRSILWITYRNRNTIGGPPRLVISRVQGSPPKTTRVTTRTKHNKTQKHSVRREKFHDRAGKRFWDPLISKQ